MKNSLRGLCSLREENSGLDCNGGSKWDKKKVEIEGSGVVLRRYNSDIGFTWLGWTSKDFGHAVWRMSETYRDIN